MNKFTDLQNLKQIIDFFLNSNILCNKKIMENLNHSNLNNQKHQKNLENLEYIGSLEKLENPENLENIESRRIQSI